MKKFIAGLTLAAVSSFAWTINGTGASFPYPVYKQWIKGFYQETGNKVNYTATGSGTGIKEVVARHVDFGGSDKPLSPAVLKKAKLYQFPTVVGGITLAYNIPGVNNLKLSEAAIEGIVLGTIQYWDNPVIAKYNPNAKLPHKKIIFVHRSDKSGTTFNFTYYLSKMSSIWRKYYGAKKALNWPTDEQGRSIAGKGNFGVSAAIKTNTYSIGYVDYADAVKNNLNLATVQGKDGKFYAPTPKNFAEGAAFAGFDPKQDFYKIIAYPQKGYPIIAATFILLPKEKTNTNKKVTTFFSYGYDHDEMASKLGYIPLPSSVKAQVKKYWEEKGIAPSK
ncbi:phosphate ABC transporter substrate-binding protein PstS [Caminibacter mediatlanticus TB-2]|uniref:Phosphate-binding protein n=1 Tax=Caminibacter mediatlanticus TB-2 TaxID=391592 RepID=A0AAI9AIV8_9BACT|nr:phosphate ABC transporter substrate-binding protein PstS [Caminibacter mediatlanticus]EDM24436.1 phosphate-binding periplasmic protein [Caminibacter mediatlanticus TB-2]QCT95081.1 phosphate ABC transporter substrate-binding protein PstS [Caminibacter mediatlanticus TB-2]